MGKASRDKGARWERKLVHMFRAALPGARVERGLQYRDGAGCPDVNVEGVLHVEAKCGKKPNPRAALEQATADAAKGVIPVCVVRDDRKPPFVVMSLDDFLEVLQDWWRQQNT